MRPILQLLAITIAVTTLTCACAQPPLTYLDAFCDPYYPGTDFPKLTTPQWVGEEGVDAVVTLGIDDMRDPQKYEAYLRPILDRLKRIDGRAPVSIMTNSIDPYHRQLQRWLAEGVSIECHTIDHPCPCLQEGDFDQAKSTYDRCVDLMNLIPGNHPVAFRFPCMDSLNTPSPRAFAEIINQRTASGHFLQASSSVMCVYTPDDPALPPELTRVGQTDRFERYFPFESFVNRVDNYPYPFVIGRLCWEFPCATPDDWQGQNLHQPFNPQTVEDMLASIDATVIKRGINNIIFHPHGWIRPEQIVQLIDQVQQRHGNRVKFLTFRECMDRINQHLLLNQPIRAAGGGDNGVRLIDLNNDGFQDVLVGNESHRAVRIWDDERRRWDDRPGAFQLTAAGENAERVDLGVKFGSLTGSGRVCVVVNNSREQTMYVFDQGSFRKQALPPPLQHVATVVDGLDQGVRLRDLDGDGISEILIANPEKQALWTRTTAGWVEVSGGMPVALVDDKGRDNGVRFADLDGDGFDDLIVSNDRQSAGYQYDRATKGFTTRISGQADIPPIVSGGKNHGAWIANGFLWWQNESTADLPDGVDRRSFAQLMDGS